MITTETTPIAKTYYAKIEWQFFGRELPPTITNREEAYWYIREAIAKEILSWGFDSFSDIVDSVEISETKEKI